MQLKTLLQEVGCEYQHSVQEWNAITKKYEDTGNVLPYVQCHSKDKKMVLNHMKDELPMFIKFGPVALFAIKIPTPERFAVFMAQSLGGYQYQIQRYSHNKEKFNQIRAMLEGPKPFEMHTSDEYKMFETLELMSK